jgi:hypothetical protein
MGLRARTFDAASLQPSEPALDSAEGRFECERAATHLISSAFSRQRSTVGRSGSTGAIAHPVGSLSVIADEDSIARRKACGHTVTIRRPDRGGLGRLAHNRTCRPGWRKSDSHRPRSLATLDGANLREHPMPKDGDIVHFRLRRGNDLTLFTGRLIFENGQPYVVPDDPVLGTSGPQFPQLRLDANSLEELPSDVGGRSVYLHRGDLVIGQ